MKSVFSDSKSPYLGLLILISIFLLYANTLESPFVFDDSQIFENNTRPLQGLSWNSLKEIGSSKYHSERFFPNLSLAINYSLNGHDVRGYHWFNISVHALAALTVYLLLNIILKICSTGDRPHLHREVAFLAALLWAVHPLQTNAVNYIIQRMTSMAALFYMLAVLFYLRARLENSHAQAWYQYALALVFGIMALFSKENTAVLPVTILCCELYFVQATRSREVCLKKYLLLGLLVLGIFLGSSLVLLGTDPLTRLLSGYEYRDFTLSQRLLTETRVIFYYLSLLILPLPSRLNIAHDFPLSTGLLSPPQTLFAIIGLIGLAALVILLFKRHRLMSFALFWFLINLSIESSFIPLMIIFEHRMYLPSVLLICAGVYWCYTILNANLHLARGAVIVVIILFSFFTWQRNTTWKSEISLWSDVVVKSPGLAWGHANLGKAYADKKEYELAEKYLQQAISLDPENGLGYKNLGVVYYKLHRPHEANLILNKALKAKIGDHAKLYRNLAIVNIKLGNVQEAISYAQQAINDRPWQYQNYDVLASVYLSTGEFLQAEKIIRQAIGLFPQRGDLHIRLAEVYEKQNRQDQAFNIIKGVFDFRDVNLAKAHNQLGIIYWRMGDLPASIKAAQKALEIDPGYLDAYLTLGISYEDSGRLDLAFKQFNKGWQQGLDMVTIYNNWAVHNMRNNNPDRAILYLQQALRLEPGRAEIRKTLSQAYARKGRGPDAKPEDYSNPRAPIE